jgi:glycosyltransferase involved in cell wall biosynthesis
LLAIGRGKPDDRWRRVSFKTLRIPGVNHIIDAMRSPLALPDRRRVRDALRDCALLHVQYPFFLGWTAIGEARRQGLPVVCSFHVQPENILGNLGVESERWSRWLYRLFRAGFYDRSDRVIAPSVFAAELLHRAGVRTPVTVVSNGIPDMLLQLPRQTAADGPLEILSVGRLAREKRQMLLLEAIARSRYRERIRLSLVGAGPLAESLAARSRQLGVRADIGPVDDATLLARYRSADLFVHCGGVELEGMSVLEAMAAGNAVLVSAAAASASGRLVQHPLATFAPGDPGELACRIDDWLDSPERRRREGEVNRALAGEFRHGRCVTALLDVYRELSGASEVCDPRVRAGAGSTRP